jgi:uncharacterized membrane protein HdeD (DUF308 family)
LITLSASHVDVEAMEGLVTNTGNSAATASAIKKSLAEHWRLFLIEGILLLVLGAGAIIVPQIASLAVAVVLGWLFLIGGTVGLVMTVMSRRAPGFWWSLLSAIVTIAVGVVLIVWPLTGVMSLTLVLTAFLAADGALMILFGLDHRRQLSGSWGWFVVNGLVDWLLAILIVLALPDAAAWALGLIIGIDLIFGGASLVTMALAVRKPAI